MPTPPTHSEQPGTEERAYQHRAFWKEVEEAHAEHKRGESVLVHDVEELIADLELESPVDR